MWIIQATPQDTITLVNHDFTWIPDSWTSNSEHKQVEKKHTIQGRVCQYAKKTEQKMGEANVREINWGTFVTIDYKQQRLRGEKLRQQDKAKSLRSPTGGARGVIRAIQRKPRKSKIKKLQRESTRRDSQSPNLRGLVVLAENIWHQKS